jgi:hypothetical protein
MRSRSRWYIMDMPRFDWDLVPPHFLMREEPARPTDSIMLEEIVVFTRSLMLVWYSFCSEDSSWSFVSGRGVEEREELGEEGWIGFR